MGAPILTTPVDFNTFQPLCFARNRFNEVIMCNGIDAPIVWPGLVAKSAYTAGIDAPSSNATITSPTGGNATAGDYAIYVRFLDWRDNRKLWSNASSVHTETAAASDKFRYASLPTSSQDRVGFIELWRSTAGQAEQLYLDARLILSGSVIDITNDGGNCKVQLENGLVGMAVGQEITIASNSVGAYNTTHVVNTINASDDTVTTNQSYSSSGTGGTFTTPNYESTLSDANLQTNEHMNIFTSHRQSYLNRHTPPPNYRSSVFDFGDRTLWTGMVKYTNGTIATTANTRTITGTSTDWTAQMVGRFVHLDEEAEPMEIISFTSATSIDVAPVPQNTNSGKSYAILPDAISRRAVDISERDLPESVPLRNRVIIQENIRDSDDIDWGFAWGGNCYVGGLHTIYRLTFRHQPFLDAQPRLVARRGMFNHRCWEQHEGVVFLMDDEGPWAFANEQVIPIDKQIHDKWYDGTIDFTKSKWFSVDSDPLHEVIYFRVFFTGDSGTRPKRFFEYDIRNKRWNDGKLPWEIGGGARVHISGQQRLIIGADNDEIYMVNEGTKDGTTASGDVRVTVKTVESTTQFTVEKADGTAATLPTDIVDSPVWIIRGTGAGQEGRIASRDDGDTFTIDSAFSTAPVAGSVMLIGGIQGIFKTGLFRLIEKTDQDVRRDISAAFEPTTSDAEFFLELYTDHQTSPVTFHSDRNQQRGVTIARNATEAIADMKRTQRTGGDDPGMKTVPHSGRLDSSRLNPSRWIGFNLTVYQADDQITFYGFEIGGAQEER